MKRFLAVLLCLAMIFSVTACKPDNITYPSQIKDPTEIGEEETPAVDTPEQPEETAPEKPDREEETQIKDADTPAEEPKEEAEEAPLANPLAAEDFTPGTGTASALEISGMIKPGEAISALKNRTIEIYTADSQPAFSYQDKKGGTVTEWQWMEHLAEENGFLLKYSVKNRNVSVKAQRVALYAGKKLSLLQMTAEQLGDGLTLAASAADLLNTDVPSFGISKTILEQSDYKLFAPVGNAETLWYDPALMPKEADPEALTTTKKWTVEQFKTICDNAQGVQRLKMGDLLPWATLSGRSPLTLLDGKLDSNINAGATRAVWSVLKAWDLNALRAPLSESQEQPATALFTYTDTPSIAEGMTLKYAPLPALEEGAAGTVTYAGTFFALPKYEKDSETRRAALNFAELWCNRYTEARAGVLQTLGLRGAAYQQYCHMVEAQGKLILRSPEIENAAEDYLSGLTDPKVDMVAAYEKVRSKIDGLIAARNLYY